MEIFALNGSPKGRPATVARLQELKDQGYVLVGVEVTDAEFESFLDLNFDPQHRESGDDRCAAVAVRDALLTGLTGRVNYSTDWALVTSKFDLDSLAGIALLKAAYESEFPLNYAALDRRLRQIARSDSFVAADWQPQPFVDDDFRCSVLQALGNAIDAEGDPFAKVGLMAQWLETGDFEGREAAEDRVIASQRSHAELAPTWVDRGVAYFANTSRRFVSTVGYRYAPVVVWFNPDFFGVPKWTICQWSDSTGGYIDLESMCAQLNAIEQNGSWGGQPTIKGSPRDCASSLTADQILTAVLSNLK